MIERKIRNQILHGPRDVFRAIRRGVRRCAHIPRDAGRSLKAYFGYGAGSGSFAFSARSQFSKADGKVEVSALLCSYLKHEFGQLTADRVQNIMTFYEIFDEASSKKEMQPRSIEQAVERIVSLNRFEPAAEKIDVSIIVPCFNNVKLALVCIEAILRARSRKTFEILIADDSTDPTHSSILGRLGYPVRVVKNSGPKGFLHNCNNASLVAVGKYLVFLNNDTIVLDWWLDELIITLESNKDAGLVGSRLLFADGLLQEAGGIVFSDANGWNYGRGENASLPQYNFMREVDYVSGASIAISNELWTQLGGFDAIYAPAYYEDTDLAFRVRREGKKVIYQPLSTVIHFEGASHGRDPGHGIKSHQAANRIIFLNRWIEELEKFGGCDPINLPAVRSMKGRIIIVDHEIPTPDKDSGSLDVVEYITALQNLGYLVTFMPYNMRPTPRYFEALCRRGVQVITWRGFDTLRSALASHVPSSDAIFLFRYNIASDLIDFIRGLNPSIKVIFQTVDLHHVRMNREAELYCDERIRRKAKKCKTKELEVISAADATIVLSEYEREYLSEKGYNETVYHIPIFRSKSIATVPTFMERDGIIFLGGFRHPPNVDGLKWFIKEIWPKLQESIPSITLTVIGADAPDDLISLASHNIRFVGNVQDLTPFFQEARISIAPIRYGAGLKGKVATSLSYSVPVVGTSMAFEGSKLEKDSEVLVGDSADAFLEAIYRLYLNEELWAKLSTASLEAWERTFSFERGKADIANLLRVFSQIHFDNSQSTI